MGKRDSVVKQENKSFEDFMKKKLLIYAHYYIPDLIYSLNAGDVHWCVNAKGIKGVSCPSNVYFKLSVAV